MTRIVLDDVDPAALLSINEQNRKGHWARKKCADYWHARIKLHTYNIANITSHQRAHITVTFRFPTNHLRDTPNLYPAAKALIDAFVKITALLPGDDDRYVTALTLRRDPENGAHRVVVDVEEVGRG